MVLSPIQETWQLTINRASTWFRTWRPPDYETNAIPCTEPSDLLMKMYIIMYTSLRLPYSYSYTCTKYFET